MLKVCPRTGMIIKGPGPFHPPQFFPAKSLKSRKKTDNMFPATPVPLRQKSLPPPEQQSQQQQQTFTIDQLRELAKEIGKSIAESMGSIPIEAKITLPQGYISSSRTVKEEHISEINIDESIMDVGLDPAEDLKVGEQSKSATTQTATADKLQSSLGKLRQLKK